MAWSFSALNSVLGSAMKSVSQRRTHRSSPAQPLSPRREEEGRRGGGCCCAMEDRLSAVASLASFSFSFSSSTSEMLSELIGVEQFRADRPGAPQWRLMRTPWDRRRCGARDAGMVGFAARETQREIPKAHTHLVSLVH